MFLRDSSLCLLLTSFLATPQHPTWILCPRHDIIGYSNECLVLEFPRARWMKMSKKYWSKSLPCVRTSPRRSKVDSLAGHWPLVVHLCVISGVVGSHCHCSHSWYHCDPCHRTSSLSRDFFLRTGPWRRLSSVEPLRDFRAAEGKDAVTLSDPELGSVTPRSLVPALAAGHLPWYLPS